MRFIIKNIHYYNDLDISFPSPKYETIKQFKIDFRNNLTKILLANDQPVLFDASGHKRRYRDQYLKSHNTDPAVKIVIVWVDIGEDDLLKRLKERDGKGGSWQRQLLLKGSFEPPEPDEADLILHYDQTNYQEIEDRLRALL